MGLTISGQGPEQSNINDLAEELSIASNLKIRGWQDPDILIDHYKLSDVFLLTSEYEGYGMTLIEAAAAGCPIVTTEVGIAKTNLFKNGENSFVCPVGDVDCLADSVIELLSHPEKRELFKRQMQASIKAMSISREQYVAQYIGLLESLLQNS